jgi:integrase
VAALCQKRGASGALSPYWQAIVSFNGTKIWLSTKCRDRQEARKVSDRWSEAAQKAQEWRLNQVECDRLLSEIGRVTKCPATLDNSRELFKKLLLETTGESYAGANLSEFCEEWLQARTAVTKPTTLGKYAGVVRVFIDSLPVQRRMAAVASIQAREVRQWRDGLVAQGISESTANVALIIIRSLFTDARRQGILVTNPADAVKTLNACNTDERIPFSAEQVQALLRAADSEWKGMVLLGFHCGLRIGDAADLRWSNIDLVNRVLAFEQKKVAHRKKKHQRVTTIYLHDDVVNYLTKVGGNDDPDAPLFPSLCGLDTGSADGLSLRFRQLMMRAGIKVPTGSAKSGKGRVFRQLSFHSLRHSFCSRLANSEVPMEVRKTMSGHSSDAVHANYSHLEIGLQKSAIAKLTSVL